MKTLGEFQLTNGIQMLIEKGLPASAVKLGEGTLWFDVRNPKAYYKALTQPYRYFAKKEVEETYYYNRVHGSDS
jgi:dTDP-glucose pyrophosphorylase